MTSRITCCFVLLFAFVGCGETSKTPPTEISLRRLASFYGMFVTSHKGQRPASEAELKSFITEKAPGTDLGMLFRSDRDGEPYVVRYGAAAKAGPADAIAHEKTGVSGQRYVAMATTEVRLLDEAAFREATRTK